MAVPPTDAPGVDVVDSTWLAARRAAVAAAVGHAPNWPRWWPGLDLQVLEHRRRQGMRWAVPRVSTGPAAGLAGSAEVWLEPSCDGTTAHFFLRLDAPPGSSGAVSAATVRAVTHHYRTLTKQAFWALGDRLDPGRLERLTSTAP